MKKIAVIAYEKPAFLFLGFTAIAFLPVLLPFFYIKNDLVTQILPARFIISESLHAGFCPWWNPYINYGIPQYSDMNTGFWNPLLWILALIFRYNIWTITYEELLYIFLSGWSIYLVLKEIGISKKISVLAGFSYMSSGYIVGHMQHFCWITGAAFFPFVFLYFLRINKNPSARNLIAGSVFSFLFLASTHPGLIIGALYFFFFCFLAIILFKNYLLKNNMHPAFIRNNILFLTLILLLSTCLITSYIEAIPFITRGGKLPGKDTISNATTLQSYISLLFPLIVHRSFFFDTDISMRNVYTGFLTLPGLYFFYKHFNRKITIFTFICLLFYILLSSGGIFKTIANSVVPLASYVRSSGEFSLFTIFIMVISSAAGLQSLNTEKLKTFLAVKAFRPLLVSFLIFFISIIVFIFFTKKSSLFSMPFYYNDNIKVYIKNIIDIIDFPDLLLIQCFLNLATVYFLTKAFQKQNKFFISLVVSVNLILVCWLTLPFTGVGAKSKKDVNDILSSQTNSSINQPLVSVNEFAIPDSDYLRFTGLPYTYMKKMGTPGWDPYPIQINSNYTFFKDNNAVKFINRLPYIFLSADTLINNIASNDTSFITVQTTGPGYIKAYIRNTHFNYVTLLQNDYVHWQVFVDGKITGHFTGYKTFITTPIPKKSFLIEYKFKPDIIIKAAWITLTVFVCMISIALFLWVREPSGKNNFTETT